MAPSGLSRKQNTAVEIDGDIIKEGPLADKIISEFTVPLFLLTTLFLPAITYLYVFEYFIQGNPPP